MIAEKLQTQLYIGGAFVPAKGGATSDVMNPATGEVLTRVASAQAEDVDAAVEAAYAQYDGGD